MRLGNRGPGSPSARRWAFRPRSESLEGRRLLTTLDLATIQSAPLGVEMIGQNNTGAATQVTGAGYTVTDVGDLTGSGFDDYAVAADGLTAPVTNGAPAFTGTSTVYLIFGSQSVNSSTAVNYASIIANQRAGDLGQLGGIGTPPATAQVNPTVLQPAAPNPPLVGYNFNGLTFTTGAAPQSGLGFSIAALGDINGDGHDDFAIGAPNDTGGGKAYIIYGGTALASLASGTTQATKLIDLEPTTGTSGLVAAGVKVVTLMDTQTGTAGAAAGASGLQFGYSVGGLGNYINFGTTAKDVAVGAPGFNGNAGAAFAVSGVGLNSAASGSTVDLSTQVVNNGFAIEYDGGGVSRVGSSVSTAGDFDGAKTAAGNNVVDDFLIGAPGTNQAYLVYGDQFNAKTNGISNSTVGNVYPLTGTLGIGAPQNPNDPSNIPLEGLIFQNSTYGLFGFSVATAGDYNGDGLGDVIIGSPTPGGQGAASIYYGIGQFTPPAASTIVPFPSNHLTGLYPLTATAIPTGSTTSTLTTTPPLIYFDSSASTTNLAGFSVSYVGDIPGQGINGVLIGAPGSNNNQGQVYVIPGNYLTPADPTFPSPVPLQTAITSPTYAGFGLALTNSVTSGTAATAPYLGTSVSGRSPLVNAQLNTIDADAIPDVVAGAPGYNPPDPTTGGTTTARPGAGASFALLGTFLPQVPPNDVIVTAAGIGTNSATGPFSIATTPNNLTIFIYSAPAANGLPAFDPATDITSPATIVVNGVTFTNVTLTPVATPAGTVSFTINRSLLNLVAGTTINFTIRGTTTAGSVFIARASNVTITAAGGGGGGGGGGIVGPTAATILAPPIFTGIDAGLPNPPVSSLEHLSGYQPIPVTIAYQQFLPQPGFLAREEVYHHPSKAKGAHQAPRGTVLYVAAIGQKSLNRFTKKNTLSHTALSSSKFTYGKSITFTHKVKVIPRSQQTETFSA